jgi:hypothetical protein
VSCCRTRTHAQRSVVWQCTAADGHTATPAQRVRYVTCVLGGIARARVCACRGIKLAVFSGSPLLMGYGLTETAACGTISHPFDAELGHSGAVVCVVMLCAVRGMATHNTCGGGVGGVCVVCMLTRTHNLAGAMR